MTVPTNNEEREALIEAYRDHLCDLGYSTEQVTVMVIGYVAGLDARRPSVSGDSAEARNQWNEDVQAERQRQRDKGYDEAHDRKHGVDHLLVWAQEYSRIGECLKSAALVEAARELLLSVSQPCEVSGENAELIASARKWNDVIGNPLARIHMTNRECNAAVEAIEKVLTAFENVLPPASQTHEVKVSEVLSRDELDALPVGAVIQDARHWTVTKARLGEEEVDEDIDPDTGELRPAWWLMGHEGEWPAEAILLPATVLWIPAEAAALGGGTNG